MKQHDYDYISASCCVCTRTKQALVTMYIVVMFSGLQSLLSIHYLMLANSWQGCISIGCICVLSHVRVVSHGTTEAQQPLSIQNRTDFCGWLHAR